ncbi:MAG TPA: hypothetical protein VMU50_23485 [Polyangia bacterium]|nr:hypothetical protein [Polyangia bacterium]
MGRFGPRALLVFFVAVGQGTPACTTSGDASLPRGARGGSGGAPGSGGTPAPGSGGGGGAATDAPAPPPADAADAPAGTSDSAPAEAGGAACPAGALLCEGFESYAAPADLAAAWKTTTSAGATMTVDGTKAFGGGRALHIRAAAGTPSAVIIKDGAPLFPIAGNVMWGRVMMWLTATPGGNYHWNSIQSAGTIPGSNLWGKYGWGGQYGKVLAGYTVRNDPAGAAIVDCSKPSAMAFPDQRWVCVQWQFDSTKNEMHLWFDGALLTDVDVVGTGTRCVNNGDLGKPWAGPAFANLTLGWQQYQGSNGALELWLDDVAVGTQRVGCPAM